MVQKPRQEQPQSDDRKNYGNQPASLADGHPMALGGQKVAPRRQRKDCRQREKKCTNQKLSFHNLVFYAALSGSQIICGRVCRAATNPSPSATAGDDHVVIQKHNIN
jgi:hypothetical protein